MLTDKLDKDLITQPELWRLALMLGKRWLHVALYPPVAREEIRWHSFSLDPDAPSRLHALEDIIYDNPLLLCDFRRVDCIIDSNDYIIVPSDASPDHHELFMQACRPSADATDLVTYGVGDDATVIQSPESEIDSFLRRTFYNIVFHSRIALTAGYLATHPEGLHDRRAIALVNDRRLTFMAFDGNRLLAANDFTFNSPSDAAYYIMASLQHLRLDPADPATDIAIYGQSLTEPDTIAATIRPYVSDIKALPLPTLRFRASRTTLKAPFPLLILPICE